MVVRFRIAMCGLRMGCDAKRKGQGRAGQGMAMQGRAGRIRTVWMHWMLSASSLPIESCLILFVFSWIPSFSGTYVRTHVT